MEWIFFIVAIGLAGFGLWLLFDFAWWAMAGSRALARVEGFQKEWGMDLPVVTFDWKGERVRIKISRIDRVSFYLNRPRPGQEIEVIVHEGETLRARAYGYGPLLAGAVLLLPLTALLGLWMGHALLLTQTVYAALFIGLVAAALALLRLIASDR